MKLKLRKEGDSYLAYFLESRKLIEVNEVGAKILELLICEGLKKDEVLRLLSDQYNVDVFSLESDMSEFLTDIISQLESHGFNLTDQRQLSAPFGAELEITNGCNLRCKHCFQDDYSPAVMPFDRACSILDTLSENGVCEVSIIGGEPLFHPDIVGILAHAASVHLVSSITTNATMMTDELIDRLAAIPNFSVLVSLDGVNEVHDSIRGKDVFSKVDRAIQGMLAAGIEVDTIFTVNSLNLAHYMDVVDYCEAKGISSNFNLFKPFKPGHEDLVISPESYFGLIIDLFKLRKEGKQIGLSNSAIVGELLGLPSRNECTATLSGLVIDSSGRMITCPGLVTAGRYSDESFPIFDENFVKTWCEHPIFVDFRNGDMKNCQVRSLLFSGRADGNDPYGIESFRKYLSPKVY